MADFERAVCSLLGTIVSLLLSFIGIYGIVFCEMVAPGAILVSFGVFAAGGFIWQVKVGLRKEE